MEVYVLSYKELVGSDEDAEYIEKKKIYTSYEEAYEAEATMKQDVTNAGQCYFSDFTITSEEMNYINDLLLNVQNKNTKDLLIDTFSIAASSFKFDNNDIDILPIIEFAKSIIENKSCDKPNPKAKEVFHFFRNLELCTDYIESMGRKKQSENFNLLVAKWKFLLVDAKENIKNIRFSHVYSLIIDSWIYLKNYSFTYRLMFDLASMPISYESEKKQELIDIINKCCNNSKKIDEIFKKN